VAEVRLRVYPRGYGGLLATLKRTHGELAQAVLQYSEPDKEPEYCTLVVSLPDGVELEEAAGADPAGG
jgi:hypothetical protein